MPCSRDRSASIHRERSVIERMPAPASARKAGPPIPCGKDAALGCVFSVFWALKPTARHLTTPADCSARGCLNPPITVARARCDAADPPRAALPAWPPAT